MPNRSSRRRSSRAVKPRRVARRGTSRGRSRLLTAALSVTLVAVVSSLVWLTPTRAQTPPAAAPSVRPLIEAMIAQPIPAPAVVDVAEEVVQAAPAVLPGGAAGDELEYDAAGNLTYDGVYHYTYDAWNRQVTVTKAYRDDNHDLQLGSVVQRNEYDGMGRRIVVRVENSGDLDSTEHVYYDGWSQVETRNGSGITTRQTVTAGRAGGYIDEVVQVAHNLDWQQNLPAADNIAEAKCWALGDANHNVIGLVDAGGKLVERYEYTPYGRRRVYASAGANDPRALTPVEAAYMMRQMAAGDVTGGGLNPHGHQGLRHDPVTGLVENRHRVLHPTLGRFAQRDPLEYIDDSSLHEYLRSNPLTHLDPTGTTCSPRGTETCVNYDHRRAGYREAADLLTQCNQDCLTMWEVTDARLDSFTAARYKNCDLTYTRSWRYMRPFCLRGVDLIVSEVKAVNLAAYLGCLSGCSSHYNGRIIGCMSATTIMVPDCNRCPPGYTLSPPIVRDGREVPRARRRR